MTGSGATPRGLRDWLLRSRLRRGAFPAISPDKGRSTETDAGRGERIAAEHLESLGFAILARNLRVGHDEVDIVALAPDRGAGGSPIVAIVEVKTTRNLAAPPHVRIDAGKRRRLVRLAEGLLARGALADALLRFDAVGVHLGPEPPRIEHLPDCFAATWPTDRAGGASPRSS